MQIGLDQIKAIRKQDNYKTNRLMLLFLLILFILFCLSMCLRTSRVGIVSPLDAFINLKTWLQLIIAQVFELPMYLNKHQIIAQLPLYYETVTRFKITLLTMVSGMILALSGAIYQGVFRNPIAAPTMLGVSSGVHIGILLLVLNYGGATYLMYAETYKYCYGFAMLILGIVWLAGKFVGGKNKVSVTDMLIVGAVISQMTNVFVSYYRFTMDENLLQIFQEISSGIYVNINSLSFIVLGIAVVVSIIPIHLIRFSFNAVCLENDDSYSLGINARVMRLAALICGTIMITAAMIHCGDVGMISLIVPHLCRYFFGADFKNIYYGSMIFGGILLVACRDVSALFYFGYNGSLPIGSVVSFIALPLFVVVLLQQRRGWE